MSRIAVGMSGGVDSSIAAALLLEAGHDVLGVTMRLGLAAIGGRTCCGEEEAIVARRVCSHLDIAHVVTDVESTFRDLVVEPYAAAYAAGETPNPCVDCNEHVKFGVLLERARALGCEALATGHYARLTDGSPRQLRRAADAEKDQAYFLYRVRPEVLDSVTFPLGDLTKSAVRAMATRLGLPTATRPDSQDVCFAGDRLDLIARLRPGALEPGPIVTEVGEVLGEHRGIAHYTVGQRKGLGLGGPRGPWTVTAIDAVTNTLVVRSHEEQLVGEVRLRDAVWHLQSAEAHLVAECRYHATPRSVRATRHGDEILVEFETPAPRTAAGQSIVLYDDDVIVGGGVACVTP